MRIDEIRSADRRDDCVHARAVRHARVDDRVGNREFAPGQGRDPLGQLDKLARAAEPDIRRLQAPPPLDEHRVRPVDKDVGDLGIGHERLQRAESNDRRLDGRHQSRRRREFKLRVVEDRLDRVAKDPLVFGCATEGIEDLRRHPGDELLADSTDCRRRDRRAQRP